jgi:hypothetical protein
MRHLLLMLVVSFPIVLCAEPVMEEFPDPQPRRLNLFEDATGTLNRGGGPGYTGHELGDISVGGSAGIAFDRVGFLATGEMDFWIARFFSIGPLVQASLGRDIIVTAGGGPKFTLDLGDNDFSNLVKPYAHFGPGLAIVTAEHKRREEPRRYLTEPGLVLTFGLGVDFYAWENVSLGTGFLWNWLVTRPAGQTFFFGWKVIEARFHF